MLQQVCDPSAHLDTARACAAFLRSNHAKHLEEYPMSEVILARDVVRPPDVKHVSWFAEVAWLVWREAVSARRKKMHGIVQLALFLVTAAIMSMAFMDVTLSSLAGVQGVRGLLYLIVSEVVFTHSYSVFHTFPAELPVYLRESHLYSSSAYYAAKVLGTVPASAVQPLLFASVIQSQVDLTAGGGVLTFIGIAAILFLTALTASAYGCMLSALFKSPEVVMTVTQPVDFVCVLVAGIFNTIRSLPAFIKWARFVSVFYYCHELLSIVYWRNVPTIKCAASVDTPCLRSGAEVLYELGFNADDLVRDLVGLGSLCAGLHAVGFLGLLARSRQQSAY